LGASLPRPVYGDFTLRTTKAKENTMTDQNRAPPQHTSLPWAAEPRQWDHGASIAIVSPTNGYIVAIIPYDEDIQEIDEPNFETVKRHPDDLPNAEFIARACNSHYELLRTLKYVRHVCNQHDDWWIGEFISEVNAAVAQAEVQQ
jgi:hypothetical protein